MVQVLAPPWLCAGGRCSLWPRCCSCLRPFPDCFSWRPARRALRGCNDTGCGPEASSVVDVVKAVSLRLARAVDDEGNLRPRTVTANWDPVEGSQVNLAGASLVSVSGPDVTLTLASAVATGDAVTVSYAKPESSWLRNVICEYAPSFTDRPVTNSTP